MIIVSKNHKDYIKLDKFKVDEINDNVIAISFNIRKNIKWLDNYESFDYIYIFNYLRYDSQVELKTVIKQKYDYMLMIDHTRCGFLKEHFRKDILRIVNIKEILK